MLMFAFIRILLKELKDYCDQSTRRKRFSQKQRISSMSSHSYVKRHLVILQCQIDRQQLKMNNTYTIHIQYIYNTYTIHIQYIYNTYTIHIQYIHNTYTIHIQYIYIQNQHEFVHSVLLKFLSFQLVDCRLEL